MYVFLISVFYLPLGLCPNKFYEYTPPSYCCPKRLFLILQACHSRGSRGCHYTPQILTDQFTLPQLQGTDYAHHINTGPPDFQTFQRPCSTYSGGDPAYSNKENSDITPVHATSAQRCSIGHSEPFQAEM